jgi:hypothetical protein
VENLLMRYKPNVIVGEDATYGMALMVDTRYGIPVVHHGGDLARVPAGAVGINQALDGIRAPVYR